MIAQPHLTRATRSFQGLAPASPSKVAVLFNANAKRVNDDCVGMLSGIIPEDDIFLSRSPLDARRIAQSVLERGYQTIFCGGGDGTFVYFLNEILNVLKREPPVPRKSLPAFGILKLGTGNGLASWIGASPSKNRQFIQDIERARDNRVPGRRTLRLLAVDGKLTPFAGLGVDAQILNDYVWFKKSVGRGLLSEVMTGLSGYVSCAALRTLPHYLIHSTQVSCEVINGPRSPAYRLDEQGRTVGEPIAPGAPLHCGRVMLAAASMVPYYGFHFKMFPFADKRPGMMHLRLGSVSVPSAVVNLPKLWQGKWFPQGLQDFHAEEVSIRFHKPMALQVGGDAEGSRTEIVLSVADETVELLDFNPVLH